MAKKIDKNGALIPAAKQPVQLLGKQKESLVAWCNLYMTLEAGANADNTIQAKTRDLGLFLEYFQKAVGCDHPDQWTKAISSGFVKHLEKKQKFKATTINRILATLRHCARWIHHHRPFLVGNPTEETHDLQPDEPAWYGLSDLQITRLKNAAEQLQHLKQQKNQHPLRNYVILQTFLYTGLRVSELVNLDLSQYQGKHFRNVKRKGKKYSDKIFLPQEVRQAIDAYIEEDRGDAAGPLFLSHRGQKLHRNTVSYLLKDVVAQANRMLPEEEKIEISPHGLRHTMLRKVADKHDVRHALEASGHTSSSYIWRYTKPPEEEREKAIEGLY